MYTEPEKNKARMDAISESVRILTVDRERATIADRYYPTRVKRFLLKNTGSENGWAALLSDFMILRWQLYYDALLSRKRVEELKVAFLAGPNPEHDVNIMLENGILPENIWAFESDSNIYCNAVDNLRYTYPKIKLFKNSIGSFFKLTPIKFDIIYLDCCSPVYTKTAPNNINTLCQMFRAHSLNSPGVLLTNFSLPLKDKSLEAREVLALLASIYLYPKKSLNDGKIQYYPQEDPCEFPVFYEMVRKDFDYWYGEYITRLIMDLSTVFVPFEKFYEKEYFHKFFRFDSEQEKEMVAKLFIYDDSVHNHKSGPSAANCLENDDGAWACQEMNEFSIPWTLGVLNNYSNLRNSVFEAGCHVDSKICDSACESFLKQLGEWKWLQRICAIYYALFAVQDKRFFTPTINQILDVNFWHKVPHSCDIFSEQSVLGALFGQLIVPYHTNIMQSKRWTYKAKETQMYMDMFVMDECRYIYDFVPTADMILDTVNDIEQQLMYRFVLDALDKNLFYYNQEWFNGNAMVGINHKGFEAKILKNRININESLLYTE